MTKRRVLMIYDKFPPFNVSGSARVFEFARHLPSTGFEPIVLSSTVPEGQARDDALLTRLPAEVKVVRIAPWLGPGKDRLARTLNRHRQGRRTANGASDPSINPRRVFLPSSWAWRATGVPMWILEWHLDWAPPALWGALSDEHLRSVDLLWVSAPHVRNLFVGEMLSRLLHKPLVVDLRDPWTYGSLWMPRGRWVAACEKARARQILSAAARVVVTSPLTEAEMAKRFPRAHFVTITNGFTEDDELAPLRDFRADVCLFRYVGLLNERRTPDTLLAGLALACKDPALRALVRLEFVGTMAGHQRKIEQHGLGDVVTSRGPVPHRESLRLMRGSDVNVVLQTIREGQDVIAGKTFEYLAARKPVLAVVAEAGGDAWLLRRAGCAQIAPFDSPERIAQAIRACVRDFEAGSTLAGSDALAAFGRKALTRELAALFEEVLEEAR